MVGCIGDWIGALPKDAREKMEVLLHDDMSSGKFILVKLAIL